MHRGSEENRRPVSLEVPVCSIPVQKWLNQANVGNEIFSFAMYCKQHDEYVHSSKFLETFDAPFIPGPPPPISKP